MNVTALDIGPKPRNIPLEYAVVKELSKGDLELLAAPRQITAAPLKTLRESHHSLARLLAQGLKQVEISAITGFSQSRISILKSDPAFRELISHYKEVQESAFADIAGQLASLSADAIAELRDRLLDSPEQFSNVQLLEVMTSLLDRTGHGPKSTVNHNNVNLSMEDLIKLKAVVNGAQHGNITSKVIEHSPTTSSEDRGVEVSFTDIDGTNAAEATPQGGEGQGQDLRAEDAAGLPANDEGTRV